MLSPHFLLLLSVGRTVLPELCTSCFTTKQTNSLKKSSSFLLHLVPSPPHPWHFSFVCLRFTAGVSFSLFFGFCLSLGLFFFHLACYCTAVLMSWSVFSVTGKQLLLIRKKKAKKKLVKQTKLCQEQIIPIGAMSSSQVAARSFSMACLARGVTLRRESQECY